MIPPKVATPQNASFFNYIINIANAFIVFQLQSIIEFLIYNTNFFVYLQIYHDKALYNKGNMASLKLYHSSLTSAHRLHNVKTKLIQKFMSTTVTFLQVKTLTEVYWGPFFCRDSLSFMSPSPWSYQLPFERYGILSRK